MGTRSTTKIYEVFEDEQGKKHKDIILSLYKQMNGNVNGWGADLKEFIKSGTFVNGICMSNQKQFNGIGCFALQLVCEFKDGTGGLYATYKDDSQEYNYTITYEYPNQNKNKPATLTIECKEDKKFKEIFTL